MALVRMRGEMWARNPENIAAIPESGEGGRGVYILYDGSTPMYIGEGKIRQRVKQARKSKRRGQHSDHFSWYVPRNPKLSREIEALLLRMLPFYLRIVNRQRGRLWGAEKHMQVKEEAEVIRRPKLFRSSK